jgi:hypothetical protein
MLQQHLADLFRVTSGGHGQPPSPTGVVIAELADGLDEQGRPVIRKADLRTAKAYERRFEELLATGPAWINLNYCGLLDGMALVLVEFPERRSGSRSPSTSVNLSGPPATVAASGWDARSYVAVR